ncbi:hypothetical protein H6F43_07120 [Leptolyngbya sp. FACHB-36]|uniref:hypothetical protein n=1 Tax=Leptolyngbya sp. FACHB-36 TaxID=2692808 RepID=UPI0016810D6D|nr:hypothetical protein [Leptolyngbya sp. FACHB-36]MBD2019958.1 hypothetical protein [Leptolyngbya sp. FACHB-36]
MNISSAPLYLEIVGGSLLYVLFALLVGSALTLAAGRINLAWKLNDSDQITIVALTGAILLCLPLARIWWKLTANISEFCSNLRFLLWAIQGVFPLFFFILMPTPWSTKDGAFYGYPVTLPLLLLLSSFVSITYVQWFRCFKVLSNKVTGGENALFAVVSPLCMLALLLFVKAQPVGASTIPLDDYHWGEFLLPWWLSQTFHFVPFWDYEPARGLINYVPGFLATLFLDGTAASHWATGTPANPLLLLPYLTLSYLVISRPIGALPAFLALLLMPTGNGFSEIDTILAVCLCFLSSYFLKQQWVKWLVAWSTIGLVLLLFSPGQAGLLLLSTVPLAAFALFRAVRTDRWTLIRVGLGGGLLLIVLLLLTPIGKMLFGAVRYAIEQSSINSIAYGTPWADSWGTNPVLSYSLWEALRTAWIGVGLFAGLLLLRAVVDRAWTERQRVIVFTLPIVLLTILFIPRAAGRIDPASLSRLGNASIWAICLLLPIVLITAFGQRAQARSLLIVALLGGAIVGLPSAEALISKPIRTIDVSSLAFVNAVELGFPAMGPQVTIDPAQLKRLQTIRQVLDTALDPGETYLDLTNRNAQYFYLGRPLPIQAGAFYNLPHRNQQIRAIQKLETAPPPVVLVAAEAILHDGAALPLRAHLLYRYVTDRYVPIAVGEQVYLVRPDRVERLNSRLSGATKPVTVGATPADRLRLLDQAFRTKDLKKLPRSWGQSFESLRSELHPVATIDGAVNPVMHSVEKTGETSYRITGSDPYLIFDITNLSLNGDRAGVLAFDFSCQPQRAVPTLEVYWSSQSIGGPDEEAVVRFSARRGKVLVPLDAAPRWLLAKGIQTLRIDIADPAPCSTFSLSQISFFQRSNLSELP